MYLPQIIAFESIDHLNFPFFCRLFTNPFQVSVNPGTCPCCRDEIQPLRLRVLRTGGQDLYLVATCQLMAERNQTMVDFRTDTLVPDIRVKGISEVQGSSPWGNVLMSPFGVKTNISEVKRFSLIVSRKSKAFGSGLSSISVMVCNHLSSSVSSSILCSLYFQWAAKPFSAISSIRRLRICISTHCPSGPITVRCNA